MSLLERRRALLIAQNKDNIVLPSDYIKLNYIEGTGTQWINTNYLCKDDYTPYRVKCKFKMTTIPNATQFIFGTNNYPNGVLNILSVSVDVSRKKFVVSRFGKTGSGLRFSTLDTELHEFEYIFNEGSYFDKVFIEGSEQQASLTDISSKRNMGLFGRLDTTINSSAIAQCQIYSFEMYGQNENNMILVPAQRKSDGVVGMYDTVTNTFLTNSGTGDFIGG